MMTPAIAIAYVLMASAIVVRIIPRLWQARKRAVAGLVTLLVVAVGLGFMFAQPLSVGVILKDKVLPVVLIMAIFLWYARVEHTWDKELRDQLNQ